MSRERVYVECRWPDCPAVVDLPRWHTPGDEVCPEHDRRGKWCRYCLRPKDTPGAFCSPACESRDLAAFAAEAESSDGRPEASADQEALW